MVKLYNLSFDRMATYLAAALFVVGNIALPQLCHLVPGGGLTWLPIYFFTLIGAYKYGWRVGLLTALLSPVVNSLAFGMPAVAVLPAIMTKSVLLVAAASLVAHHTRRVTLPLMALVVIGYQLAGSLIEAAVTCSLAVGFQDFTIGLPGMALQIVGGFLFIRYILDK